MGFEKKKAVHTPVREGQCLKCHAPHAGPGKHLLSKTGAELCFSCHADLGKLRQAKSVHKPFASGACSRCHDPHATDNPAQLVAAPGKLCASCHNPASTGLKRAHRNFPIAKADCVSCHDPHGSPEKGLVPAAPHKVFRSCDRCHSTSGPNPGALLATGPQLCFRCHSEKRAALQKPGAHEGAKADCLACHTPHAANDRGLTAGLERDRCFACHGDIEHLQATSRTIHPRRVEKGKCSICHEPHQTSNPHLLARPEAQLCTKCHGKHAQFGHPVGSNVIDPRTGKGMTCLACHGPHGTQWPSILADNPSQPLCVRCHEAGGAMGAKKGPAAGPAPAAPPPTSPRRRK
jgi:predicted CXXCH cytochrome family protein